MSETQLVEPSLFVLRGNAVEPLQPATVFPADFATALGENMASLLGESPITLGTWDQTEHVDRPSILGFDNSGSLVAVVLSDGSDDTKARITSTVEWLHSLNLRDVLKMHASVETLMDALLAQNPNELHLSLGPARRVVLLQLTDQSVGAVDPEIFDGVTEVVNLELFAGVEGAMILRRGTRSAAVDASSSPAEPEAAVIDLTDSAVAGSTVAGSAVVGSVTAASKSDAESNPVDDVDGSANESGVAGENAGENEGDVAVGADGSDEQPVESSLAPPPMPRNTAVDAAIEPGAVSFKPGTPMRTVDLNAYLADKTGDPETVAPGCVASGKHVLLTDIITPSTVLESRGHYHRAIDDELVDRFREWYDGSIPKVTFHLLVQSADQLDETTYVGRLKPTAWEHRSGKQTLLFRVVPRVGSELWVKLSAGEVPPIPPEAPVVDEAEPWPVIPAREVEPASKRRGVRRLR